MALPTLVVICGPSGSGKTTLAHALARAIGCPVISRDEIKEGMVHCAEPGFEPAPGDELTQRTFPVFFAAIRLLVEAGVTVVAEATFQDQVWRPNLEPLSPLARVCVVQCRTDPDTSFERRVARGVRAAHADGPVLDPATARIDLEDFRHLTIEVPTLEVDTSDGYNPVLEEIVAFVGATP